MFRWTNCPSIQNVACSERNFSKTYSGSVGPFGKWAINQSCQYFCLSPASVTTSISPVRARYSLVRRNKDPLSVAPEIFRFHRMFPGCHPNLRNTFRSNLTQRDRTGISLLIDRTEYYRFTTLQQICCSFV